MTENEVTSVAQDAAFEWLRDHTDSVRAERFTEVVTCDGSGRVDGLAIGGINEEEYETVAIEAKSSGTKRALKTKNDSIKKASGLALLGAPLGPAGIAIGAAVGLLLGKNHAPVVDQVLRYPGNFRVVAIPAELFGYSEYSEQLSKIEAACVDHRVGLLRCWPDQYEWVVDPVRSSSEEELRGYKNWTRLAVEVDDASEF